MSTRGLTLAFQLLLGAVFGTALVWRQLRARHSFAAEPSSAGHSGTWDLPGDRRDQSGVAARRRSREGAQQRRFVAGIPERLRIGVLLFAAAAVPVLIGVTWAVTRSDGARADLPQVNVPAHTAPIPTSVATPSLAVQWLDAHRALDLATIREAADAYAVYFHGYPTTGGRLTPLCLRGDDPGCAIGRYATAFPTSDGEHAYWYASDGTSMTLVAQVSSPPTNDDCPAGLTAPLGNVSVLCVTSRVDAN